MSRSRGRRVRAVVGSRGVRAGERHAHGPGDDGHRARPGPRVAKNDPGIGSAEALKNPQCDPTTKRIRYQTYSAPLCVKAWKDGADNGGKTAQGVTKDRSWWWCCGTC